MLSLGCVCYIHSISSGVRYVPLNSFQRRCLAIPDKRRREHITSCLSLLYHCLLEAWGRTSNHALPMDKKYKLSYDPPKVAVVAFKVENGLQTSRIVDMGSVFTPFDDATWDNPSSSTATGLFGDGDWTGGSSFSSNSSFGSGSWDN